MSYATMLTLVLYACYFSGAVVTYALCGNKRWLRLIAALIIGLVLALTLTPCVMRGVFFKKKRALMRPKVLW
jgi:hypothetical protein